MIHYRFEILLCYQSICDNLSVGDAGGLSVNLAIRCPLATTLSVLTSVIFFLILLMIFGNKNYKTEALVG